MIISFDEFWMGWLGWAYWKTEDLELVLHWKTWKELAFFRCMMHLKWLLLLLSKMLVLYWVNLQFARCGLGIVVSHTFGRETQFESKKTCPWMQHNADHWANACQCMLPYKQNKQNNQNKMTERPKWNYLNKLTITFKTKWPIWPKQNQYNHWDEWRIIGGLVHWQILYKKS